MLQSYQQAVEAVLQEDFYPGVSADELELFKNHYRTSAYTCRLRFCPRATIGFDNKQLRYEHEITHATFRCIQPDCQYPPFDSAQALKAHMNRFHDLLPTRKSIRKPGRENLRPQQSGFRLPTGTGTREDDQNVKKDRPGYLTQLETVRNERHYAELELLKEKQYQKQREHLNIRNLPLASQGRSGITLASNEFPHKRIENLIDYEMTSILGSAPRPQLTFAPMDPSFPTHQLDRCKYTLRRESAD
jgi:hypothetical protein